MIQPLASEIVVSFNGSHFDLSRLRGGGADCATDLAAIYTELFNRLRESGLYFRPPAGNQVTWAEQVTGPGGVEALGGWDPGTRNFVLHADLALVPELVRDVVAHEMVHQLMSEHPQPLDHTQGGHGDRFYAVAQAVAQALDMPTPNRATVAVWPTLDRPVGFYGPLVGYRRRVDLTAEDFISGIQEALTPDALRRTKEALRRRKPGATPFPDTVRPVWAAARAQAKRAVLADNDISGVGTEHIWAAVTAAMDAAGAYAVREHINPHDFEALIAPWQYLMGEAA